MSELTTTTVKEFLEAGSHFGHKTKRWNPKMRQYIYGARNGIHIIDLQQTVGMFQRAANFVRSVSARGEKILFVGTKPQAQDIIAEQAGRSGQYYVAHRWLGGTLTNFSTIKQTLERMKTLERMEHDGSMERLVKKEQLRLRREKLKLERNLGGIRDMTRLPGAMFVVDPSKERIPIAEANKLGIPLVAIADSNCNPDPIDYIIPSNDDALRAIRLIVTRLADAAVAGAKEHQAKLAGREGKGGGRDGKGGGRDGGRSRDNGKQVVEVAAPAGA